jgi:hypothetical protein
MSYKTLSAAKKRAAKDRSDNSDTSSCSEEADESDEGIPDLEADNGKYD